MFILIHLACGLYCNIIKCVPVNDESQYGDEWNEHGESNQCIQHYIVNICV